jgi:protein arginine kinase activator
MFSHPPQCHQCIQSSTVFFTLVANEKAQTLGCCKQCPLLENAEKAGALPSELLHINLAVPTPLIREKCPACGFRWEDFERTHRMGCPVCYQIHSKPLAETIALIQPGPSHIGRHPSLHEKDRLERLTRAKILLEEAIREEDFESAAALRDQISDLESKK